MWPAVTTLAAILLCAGHAEAFTRSVGSLRRQPLGLRRLRDAGMSDGVGDDVTPAPASVGADVPLTYFGPAPSQVDPRLIGPFQLLKSGTVNEEEGTVTMPIYKGVIDSTNTSVFYVVFDTSDKGNAEALGLNFSPKLAYTNVGNAARKGYLAADLIAHWEAGNVDFSPVREVVPGTDSPFPPSSVTPGARGDEMYSPLLVLSNAGGHVYNAPIVASGGTNQQINKYCEGISDQDEEHARKILHDRVVNICPSENGLGGTVTLELSPGFSFARPILYASTDSNDETAAALEAITYAPALGDVPVGADDSLFSGVERIFIMTNGYTNEDVNTANRNDGPTDESSHPLRQGLNSAIMGEGGPLNTLGGIPTIATDYSPLWDANIGEWTPYAVENNYRVRVTEEFQILGLVQQGYITVPVGNRMDLRA